MISVCCFKWNTPGYRSQFTGGHVNTLKAMVERCYPDPHRFICLTDDPAGIDASVEVLPLWDTFKDLKNPNWPDTGPSCYRRLPIFSKDFARIAGPRFVSIDIDVVLTADVRPLWNRDEDFVIYASATAGYHYNGSMMLMTTGARSQVFEDFDPERSPRLAMAAGNNGSDQGWIQYRLGRHEARWTRFDGVYGYRTDMKGRQKTLPEGARIVIFHGKPDPWDEGARAASPWIAEHYRA